MVIVFKRTSWGANTFPTCNRLPNSICFRRPFFFGFPNVRFVGLVSYLNSTPNSRSRLSAGVRERNESDFWFEIEFFGKVIEFDFDLIEKVY